MSTLYVVSTPIGNLEDITLRALRVLQEVSLIAAEDTRHTRKLLNRFKITTPTISYHQHSSATKTAQLLEALQAGDVALVTDAGTPGLSDPGGELVAEVARAGFDVVSVPGASALLTLVAASGLPSSHFTFLGFLPRKKKDRDELLDRAAQTEWAFVVYEAPQRTVDTLRAIGTRLGQRQVVVGRELTKLHEETFRGTINEAIKHFEGSGVRGEVAIMVAGATREDRQPGETSSDDLVAVLTGMRAEGLSAKQAARLVSERTGVSVRAAYNLFVKLGGSADNQANSGGEG